MRKRNNAHWDYYEECEDYDWEIEDGLGNERNTYREFIKDTSDDYILWIKNNAQVLYYRKPFKSSQE